MGCCGDCWKNNDEGDNNQLKIDNKKQDKEKLKYTSIDNNQLKIDNKKQDKEKFKYTLTDNSKSNYTLTKEESLFFEDFFKEHLVSGDLPQIKVSLNANTFYMSIDDAKNFLSDSDLFLKNPNRKQGDKLKGFFLNKISENGGKEYYLMQKGDGQIYNFKEWLKDDAFKRNIEAQKIVKIDLNKKEDLEKIEKKIKTEIEINNEDFNLCFKVSNCLFHRIGLCGFTNLKEKLKTAIEIWEKDKKNLEQDLLEEKKQKDVLKTKSINNSQIENKENNINVNFS